MLTATVGREGRGIIIERIQSNMEVGVGEKDVNGQVNHGVFSTRDVCTCSNCK